ncbi:MAG TPA: hypothetical protein VGY58_00145 [Gemmataceae bacterium]|nr:hypothetical protein [Gemmataceae bacterium]
MAWAQKPAAAKNPQASAILAGFDVNATRALAVHGPASFEPRVLPLDDDREELPMILSLAARRPQVGRAGAALCRQSPHLICADFLASLGEKRQWVGGRHRLDPSKATAVVLDRLHGLSADSKGLVVALPGYLTRSQVTLLTPLAQKARWPVLGSVQAPLAAALAIHAVHPWSGLALVLDTDDHALTVTTVFADGEQLYVQAAQAVPHLNLRAWKSRMLDMVADRCIRQSRRDPRDSATAEQTLYDQLEDALDSAAKGKTVDLLIQTPQWYQNLLLRPEEFTGFCERLVSQTIESVQRILTASSARDVLSTVIVSASAGRLPGLVPALEIYVRQSVPAKEWQATEDFGDNLMQPVDEPVRVNVLLGDAVARVAHELACRIQRGELPHGHLDLVLPLPKATQTPAGGSKRTFRVFSADKDQ